MAKFELHHEWIDAQYDDISEFSQTMVALRIRSDSVNLTEHKSVFSKELQEEVIVSAYPLATWLAHSWWRLLYEPLPLKFPSADWRMTHEMGAINHGFVWPRIALISDSEYIHIFAKSNNVDKHSVCYVNGLDSPSSISIDDFKVRLSSFINGVVGRLDNKSIKSSDLHLLWEAVQEEQNDAQSHSYRKLEAQMGYDPDDCPEALMDKVLALQSQMGESTLSELIPTYGEKSVSKDSIQYLNGLIEIEGIEGKPDLPKLESNQNNSSVMPWQRAIKAARELRKALDNVDEKIEYGALFELLGIAKTESKNWQASQNKRNFSLAIPVEQQKLKFLPRKSHPLTKRFELARFLGDYIYSYTNAGSHWLTNTDLSTARQKYQRAFAAEFLCPIESLKSILQDNFSDSAIEEAASYFEVSEKTVTALLQNNHVISYSTLDTGYSPWNCPQAA